jgi:flagellar P-ring protein precursor FlgI
MRLLSLILALLFVSNHARADARIKDIVYVEGIRDNVLIGYGLIVGLNGTGDNLKNSVFTEKGLSDFLEKLGINTRGSSLKTKNVAAVTVTAILPPFARTGSKINIDVSTIGDAKSLKGGTLLATPLLGADGEVYAVAQGAVSIGSKPNDDPTKPATMNPTAGYITNGAIIEREISFELRDLNELNIALKNPDITTARSIQTAINSAIQEDIALATDPGTVKLQIPNRYVNNPVGFLAEIENIKVSPDSMAKIVIDEASGTIVIGENVKVNKVAIAQGNLVLKVSDDKKMQYNLGLLKDMPLPTNPGEEIGIMPANTKLADLIEGLNLLGVKPRDLVAILKSIKQAGAMQAEIETR